MKFYEHLDRFGETPALITEDGEISYRTLQDNISVMAGCLRSRTLAFCVCGNNPESVIGYLAFLSSKVVPVMIRPGMEESAYQTLLQLYKPQYIWSPKGDGEGKAVFCHGEYCLWETNWTEAPEMYADLALLLTTSGSTGSPKFVRQSYRNIQSNAESISEYLAITAEDRPITTLPMSYTYGLSVINSHLLKGASIVLTEYPVVHKHFWEIFDEKQATTFNGVPYTYEMLKRIRFFQSVHPSLRIMTQAGGKLGKELHQEFAEYCQKNSICFYVMYGQTEATARISYVPAERTLEKSGSIGIAIPGGTLQLVEDGVFLQEPHSVGELVYSGPNVTLGYAQCREDLAKGDERNGVLYTGDLAYFDEDGYFYIAGRKKRFLKIYGNRVNLDEAEAVLKKNGYTAVCYGADDKLQIFVENAEPEKARKCLLENTTIPRQAVFAYKIREIPRNDSGKILYTELESSVV